MGKSVRNSRDPEPPNRKKDGAGSRSVHEVGEGGQNLTGDVEAEDIQLSFRIRSERRDQGAGVDPQARCSTEFSGW